MMFYYQLATLILRQSYSFQETKINYRKDKICTGNHTVSTYIPRVFDSECSYYWKYNNERSNFRQVFLFAGLGTIINTEFVGLYYALRPNQFSYT
jgi:hypothetical protein